MAKPTTALKTVPASVPATTETAPVKRGRGRPPGGAAKAPVAKKGKPTQWMKWGKQAARCAATLKQLEEIGKIIGSPNLAVEPETLDDIAGIVSELQKLDANRMEVPKIPKAPKPPAFAVGDAVTLAKQYRDAYLESGLYGPGALDNLSVIAVAQKGIMCTSTGSALQIFVRYPKHLEKR